MNRVQSEEGVSHSPTWLAHTHFADKLHPAPVAFHVPAHATRRTSSVIGRIAGGLARVREAVTISDEPCSSAMLGNLPILLSSIARVWVDVLHRAEGQHRRGSRK